MAKFKETLPLRLLQVWGQPLRVSASFSAAPLEPHSLHPSPSSALLISDHVACRVALLERTEALELASGLDLGSSWETLSEMMLHPL